MAGVTYKRVQVEFGSVKFWPNEAKYSLARNANQVGRRIGDSLQARAYVWMDAHDTSRLSQDQMVTLWKSATDPKDTPQKVAITYYAEDGDKVLSSVEFMGWISAFETYNPSVNGDGRNTSAGSVTSLTGANNMLYIELVAALDEPNVSKHKLTK